MLRVPYPEFDGSQICAQVGVDLMFVEGPRGGINQHYNNLAKKLCANCPFVEPCAEWGIHHESDGLWGGMSPAQRRRVRRERNITLLDPYMFFMYGEAANGAQWREDATATN